MTLSKQSLHQTLVEKLEASEISEDLLLLLENIATSCHAISHSVRNGVFDAQMGAADSANPQGETQQKLDIVANDIFIENCSTCSRVAALVSEEIDDVIWLSDTPKKGDFVVYFDPLDGSSNIDVNLSVGSIFSVVELDKDVETLTNAQALIEGNLQICAGYAIYGSSTTLVMTLGTEVDGFTQSQDGNEFLLSHSNLRIPENANEFAINTSRSRYWYPPVRRYVDECVAGKTGSRGKNFNMRWTASMVAEVHRILVRGGVFLYPSDQENEHLGGKLRLLYEASPMALIVECAGGAASTGRDRILDLVPQSHHQRVPVILGSKSEVERLVNYHS